MTLSRSAVALLLLPALLLPLANTARGDDVGGETIQIEPVQPPPEPPPAPPPVEESDWDFSLTPYLWLPSIDGVARVANLPETDVGTGFWKIVSNGGFAIGLMARGEALWKRRLGVFFDGSWTYIRQDNILKNTLLENDAVANLGIVEFGAFYRFGEGNIGPDDFGPSWVVDGIAGARFNIIAIALDFKNLSNQGENEWWGDPIFGGRVGFRFGPRNRIGFSVRGDAGGFDAGSDLAWNLVGGLHYSVHMGSIPTDVSLMGRALYQDYDSGRLKWDTTMYGPILAMTMRF